MDRTKISKTTGYLSGFGSKPYRSYVLGILTLVYTLNFIDRIIISVVGGPIIREFGLSNFQFGMLTGLAFAFFYTLLGIPIASLSERFNRVRIISACVVLWSLATVLCGFTGGFLTLLLARMLVGVGEAGCTPPANSLISDYYKASSRPTALGVYAMGITAGGLLAQLFGGSLLSLMTWRDAFIIVGAPGILVGALLFFTVKEPPRGYSDPPNVTKTDKASFIDTLLEIGIKPTFWLVVLAGTLAAAAGYSLTSFQPLHIQWSQGISPQATAIFYMAPVALAGTIGAFLGGYLTEKASSFSKTAASWVPGIAHIICAPVYAFAFLTNNLNVMLFFMIAAGLFQYTYLGAQYNLTQSIASVRSRATAVALFLFFVNIIGYGGGPPFFGWLADTFTAMSISHGAFSETLAANCALGDETLTDTLRTACLDAKAYGVKWANVTACGMFVLSGLAFLCSAITLRKDSVLDDGA